MLKIPRTRKFDMICQILSLTTPPGRHVTKLQAGQAMSCELGFYRAGIGDFIYLQIDELRKFDKKCQIFLAHTTFGRISPSINSYTQAGTFLKFETVYLSLGEIKSTK